MKNWLKFFFGSFFIHGQASLAPRHKLLNAALAFLVGIALLYAGLMIGFLTSFDSRYSDSPLYNAAVQNLFTLGGEGKLSVKIENGRAVSGANGAYDNGLIINTFDSAADAEKYRVNGYDVILDTRPLETTYDDFTAYGVRKRSGERISYEKYKNELTDAERADYDFTVEYSGRALEFTADKLDGYTEYLKSVADENSEVYNAEIGAAYAELENKRADMDEHAYSCALYELYIRAYYPSLTDIERYGGAPTMRTYYAKNILTTDKAEKYLVIFDESMFGLFIADDGGLVVFNGRYTDMNGFEISGESAEDIKRSADAFISRAFDGMKGSWMSLYVMNVLRTSLILFLVWVVCALIMFVVCKITKNEYGLYFRDSFAIVGSFLLVPFFISAVAALASGFTVLRDAAFGISVYLFCGILAVRTIIHMVIEGVKFSKEKRLAAQNPDSALDDVEEE